LVVASALWLLGGVWEYAVTTRSPEANIRVDLLLLLPLFALISVWAVVRALTAPR